MHTRALILDVDDTLLHSVRIKWAQHQEVARQFYGFELDESTLRSHWGKPSKELVKVFYPAQDTIEEKLEHFHLLDHEFPKLLIPDTITSIRSLAAKGLVLGIVSNARKSSLEHDLKRLDIPTKYFQFIYAFEDTLVYKPDPAAFDLALSFLRNKGVDDITYAGDSLIDLEAATFAGIKFIGVTSGLTNFDEFTMAGATAVVGSIREIVPLFV